ncbi:MAG: pseudaminic acid cytidylyltransferase [Boseongicola sp.]|nr:MAG: pseudaminic acid cytidylyltransferase [Boseongicola sp.]
MSVCLIPARGGSKRIPRKNIKLFMGKPMIGWSIDVAKAAQVFDRVIVSTDDVEIAEVARDLGAEVPFERPAEISDDHATTKDVVEHALGWLDANGGMPERLCCLYATAPFARAEDIQTGQEKLDTARFAMPVTKFRFPIQRAVEIDGDGHLRMFNPELYKTRSQDLPEAWHDAGQFYWGHTSAWLSDSLLFGPDTAAIPLPAWRVQDIDTEEDWARAEILARLIAEDIKQRAD